MRIGLYGGCFNPVHAGHMAAARGACDALALDHLLFIPSGHPPLKGDDGLVAGAHRLAMIERASTGSSLAARKAGGRVARKLTSKDQPVIIATSRHSIRAGIWVRK